MLKNPTLREQLLAIDNSKQRMTEVMEAMKGEQFYQLFEQMMEVMF
jgi:hypothetical protein